MGRNPDPIKYTFTADTSGFNRGTKRAAADLQALERQAQRTDRQLDMDLDVDTSSLDLLRQRLRAARTQLMNDIEVGVDVDAVQAVAKLQRIERQLRSLDRMDVKPEVKVDVDRVGFGRIASAGAELGLKFGDAFGDALGAPIQAGLRAVASNPYTGLAFAAGAAAAAPLIVTAISGAVGAGISAGAVIGGKSLLEEFDTLSKQVRKVSIVFGDELADVEAWSRGLSAQLGLGAVEVQRIASGVQDLLVPRGFSRADAADLTKEIVERGAALAEFSGLDIQQGIDAVNGALLGQTRQIKALGVELTAASIKERMAVLSQQEGYTDLSDAELRTLATLDLIKAGSKDAWKAWTDGADGAAATADDLLDKWNSTFANLKTDAILGFGTILAEMLGSIDFGINFDDGGLAAWIDENRDQIKAFFYDVALVTVQSAEAFVALARAALPAVDVLIGVAKAATVAARAQSYLVQWAAMPWAIATGNFDSFNDFFTGMRQSLDDSSTALDGFAEAWGTLGPTAEAGLTGAQTALDGLKGSIQDAAEAFDFTVAFRAEMEGRSEDEVRRRLETLSQDQLTWLIANLDPKSEDKTERKLFTLVKDRIADVFPEVKGAKTVEDILDALTKNRTVYVGVQFTYSGIDSPSRPRPGDQRPFRRMQIPDAGRARFGAEPAYISGYELPVRVARAAPNVTINNYYPEPERASESLAMSLRLAREAVSS